MKTAILFGASGLVGGQCLKQLLENPAYGRVLSIGRRSLGVTHPKLSEKTINFEKIDQFKDLIRGDDLYYCLGTTLSQAGSRKNFEAVDFDYPLQIARFALANGVSKWLMVTSIGSSASSPSFYLRVKGKLEKELSTLPFQGCHFFRPSLLLGKRPTKRVLEELFIPLAKAIRPLMIGPLRKLRPIDVAAVASSMIAVAQNPASKSGVHYPKED